VRQLNSNFESGVLDRFKKTFHKMTFRGDEHIIPRDYLVVMNIAPYMARRDTAYDRAVYLLRECLFSYSEEGRNDIYSSVLKLLGICIETTRLIVSPTKDGRDEKGTAILQYLLLLNDTILAASAMVRHEMALFEDEDTLSGFIGKDISKQFRSTDEIFNNSEMNIYHCISELVDMSEPTMVKYREFMKKTFSKSNLNRYVKAFAEYQTLYGNFSKQEEKSPEVKP